MEVFYGFIMCFLDVCITSLSLEWTVWMVVWVEVSQMHLNLKQKGVSILNMGHALL